MSNLTWTAVEDIRKPYCETCEWTIGSVYHRCESPDYCLCDGTHIAPATTASGYVTKDSGERAQFDSGMQRDTEAGKPRFDLLVPDDIPFEAQFITRVASLMARGAEKYDDRNWEKADSEEELRRMKSSAFRHFMQWLCGEQDEDHAAATVFNLLAYETTSHKINAR